MRRGEIQRFEKLARHRCDLYGMRGNAAWQRRVARAQLKENSGFADIYLYHRDGFIREEALRSIEVLDGPIAAFGLLARLNDWVPEVRDAASATLARCFSTSSGDVLAPAVWAFLTKRHLWNRWSGGYEPFVEDVVKHCGLVDALSVMLLGVSRKGASRVFRVLSRSPAFDTHLTAIASDAHEPHLRAAALTCLSKARVIWPLAIRKKVWMDGPMGKPVWREAFGSRPLTAEPDLIAAIANGLCDRSVLVRNAAIDALILHRDNAKFRPLIAKSIKEPEAEPRPSTRMRLQYLARQVTLD
ncbi:hypothetical protein [Silicimonas algicola]|uniref:hypothetical protein n=1 Tax=Silicimonas algicola TaxID=1826607 RepID=UPI0014763F73|nr:hypothetical protein [Silicimonas algicola]